MKLETFDYDDKTRNVIVINETDDKINCLEVSDYELFKQFSEDLFNYKCFLKSKIKPKEQVNDQVKVVKHQKMC